MKNLAVSTKLSIAVALSITLMLLISGYAGYQQSKSMLIDQVYSNIESSGQDLASSISAWQQNKLDIINATGLKADTDDIGTVLEQGLLSGDFLYVYVGTKSGEMLMRPDEPLGDDFDPRTRPWYKDALAAGKPIVTEPYIDSETGETVLSFTQPIPMGVIAGDISMEEVIQSVLKLEIGQTGRALLVGSADNIIVSDNAELLDKDVSGLFTGDTLSNNVNIFMIEGKEYLAASYTVPNTAWQVVISVETSDAFASLNTLIVSTFILSLVTIIVVLIVVVFIIRILLTPLRHLGLAMEDIASGEADLTKRITVSSEDEIGKLGKNFNDFVESIHNLVVRVIGSANEMQSLSQNTRETATANNESVHQQQSEISQVAAAIHEMSSTSAAVAQNAEQTADSALLATNETLRSETAANDNATQMGNLTTEIDKSTLVINDLNEHAKNIATILATIQGIAEQTNLLALNAAIEAARAGEQGRGFAVVADEVRALSMRTHEATGEIQTMIGSLRTQTESAVMQMDKSKQIVEQTMTTANSVSESQASIKAAINEINTQAITIAESSKEQNIATEEINRITQAIQYASQQLAENVDTAYQQAEELNKIGESVRSHLGRFKT